MLSAIDPVLLPGDIGHDHRNDHGERSGEDVTDPRPVDARDKVTHGDSLRQVNNTGEVKRIAKM